jgi:hypothetical protein
LIINSRRKPRWYYIGAMKSRALLLLAEMKYYVLGFLVLLVPALVLHETSALYSIASLFVTYKVVSPLLSRRVFSSQLFEFVAVLFIYMIVLQCVILSSWLIDKNFPLTMAPLLVLLVVLAIYVYRHFLSNYRPHQTTLSLPKISFIKRSDLLSLMIVVVILPLTLIMPLVEKNIPVNIESFASHAIAGADDTNHLAFFNERLSTNKGILENSDTGGSASFYPISWHAANAVITKTVLPNIMPGTMSQIAYALSKVFWFIVLVFLFSRVIFMLYEVVTKKSSFPAILWLTSGSFLFGWFFLTNIFTTGFYNFIPQLIATLLLIPALVQLGLKSKNQPTYSLLIMLAVGGCLPWVLPLPGFLLTVLFVLLYGMRTKSKSYFFKSLVTDIKHNLLLYILPIVAMIAQLYAMLTNRSTESISFVQGILVSGGIVSYNIFFYLFTSVGFAIYIFLTRKRSDASSRYIAYLATSTLLFAGVISVIQLVLLGKNMYYFYKVLDIFTIAVLVAGIAGFALYIDYIISKKTRLYGMLICLLLIILTVMIVQYLLI